MNGFWCADRRRAIVSLASVSLLGAAILPTLACAKGLTPNDNRSPTAKNPPAIRLAAKEKLAHGVVTGSLGPWKQVEIWLIQSNQVDDAPFEGRVVVIGAPSIPSIHLLPRSDEPESVFLVKVRSVMFRNVDRDKDNELIVLYSAQKIGPREQPEYVACVYKWKDGAFSRMADIEERLAGMKTGAEVDRMLSRVRNSR